MHFTLRQWVQHSCTLFGWRLENKEVRVDFKGLFGWNDGKVEK